MHPLIDTAESLGALLPSLEGQPRIALDTEADSLHSYFEKLCLIQLSIPEGDYLIDPLAGYSLTPLFNALEGKQLIFHGADYDLRLMRRVGFDRPSSLFDTMIAARLCGVTEFSLAALILSHFGVQLAKASQKADWGKRPLSPQMSEYAVNDTRFLLRLADIFTAKLAELGRWEWFAQSCERAITAAAVIKERDPETFWRVTGSSELSDRGNAILRALWHWRDQEAQQVDRPAFHILHNEQLVDAAHRLDKGQNVQISHLRGSRLRRFEDAIAAALALPATDWPRLIRKSRPRPSPDQDARFRELRQKRDAVATKLQLDPSLIAPKATLERLASDGAEAVGALMPWQREALELK